MNAAQQPMYQHQPGASGFQPVPVNKVVASKGWYIAKLVLGSLIAVFDIILIAVAAAYLHIYPYYYSGGVYFSVGFSPAIVSLGWQIGEFITVCVHKDRRGIHPGAHVGLHLILWMAFAVAIAILSILVYYESLRYRDYGYHSIRAEGALMGLMNSLLAFSVLNFLLHFTLFVRFCIETNRRNKLPAGMVMVAAPAAGMYFVPGGQPQYMAQGASQPLGPGMAPQQGHMSTYGVVYNPGVQTAEHMSGEQHPNKALTEQTTQPQAPNV